MKRGTSLQTVHSLRGFSCAFASNTFSRPRPGSLGTSFYPEIGVLGCAHSGRISRVGGVVGLLLS